MQIESWNTYKVGSGQYFIKVAAEGADLEFECPQQAARYAAQFTDLYREKCHARHNVICAREIDGDIL